MIDIVIAAVLIIFIAAGWKNGLIRGLVGLAAMVLAIILSAQISRAAAPKIVDRYLRPVTYAAIEERAEELSREAGASSVEELRWNLARVLDAIPSGFVREQAKGALDEVIPLDEPLGGAFLAPLEEMGKDMADAVLDTLVQDVLRSILCAALFVILHTLFRLAAKVLRIVEKLPVVRQLNELGGALVGLGKGLLLVCLAVWVLRQVGYLTPEIVEGSLVLGLLPGWISGTGK